MQSLHKPIYLLLLLVFFTTPACDIAHITHWELYNTNNGKNGDLEITLSNVMLVLDPVIKRHDLECRNEREGGNYILICKKRALGTFKLRVESEKEDIVSVVALNDGYPVIWTPEPYGQISQEIKEILSDHFGANVHCYQGFGHWPCK